MDILNLLFDHFIEILIFLWIVNKPLGAALRWCITSVIEHRERMQEKRNEGLRLSIRLEQERRQQPVSVKPTAPVDAVPDSWGEQMQMSYEQGYQQQELI